MQILILSATLAIGAERRLIDYCAERTGAEVVVIADSFRERSADHLLMELHRAHPQADVIIAGGAFDHASDLSILAQRIERHREAIDAIVIPELMNWDVPVLLDVSHDWPYPGEISPSGRIPCREENFNVAYIATKARLKTLAGLRVPAALGCWSL